MARSPFHIPLPQTVSQPLAQAIEQWWKTPNDTTWRRVLPPLYDLVLYTARRKYGKASWTKDYGFTWEDLAHSAFQRLKEDFDGQTSKAGCKALTCATLAHMRLTYSPYAAVCYLSQRALSFQRNQVKELLRRRRSLPHEPLYYLDDQEDWVPRDLEDRRAVPPGENVSPAVVSRAERSLADYLLDRLWKSTTQQNSLIAFLVHLCLIDADPMAELGVPAALFHHLNRLIDPQARLVRRGSRARNLSDTIPASGRSLSDDRREKWAIQASVLGRFLNLPRNTALKRVESFERFLEQELEPLCRRDDLDMATVCHCLLASAIQRLLAGPWSAYAGVSPT